MLCSNKYHFHALLVVTQVGHRRQSLSVRSGAPRARGTIPKKTPVSATVIAVTAMSRCVTGTVSRPAVGLFVVC
jgi:hypothetical protein